MNPEPNISPSHGPRWHYLLTAGVASVILFWQLGAPAMDDHECKLALAAKNMTERTDWLYEGVGEEFQAYPIPPATAWNYWLVPVENGRPRLVKTPLPYWSAAGVAIASGAGVNEWTARLPSACAAMVLVLVTLALGRRMLSPRAALLGALMLATAVGVQKWGRNARPEMLLCTLMTCAMAVFYLALRATSRARRIGGMVAFWLLMGLANLAKQFVPLMLVWPLAAYVLWRHDARSRGDDAALGSLRRLLVLTAIGLGVHLAVMNLTATDWWQARRLPTGKVAYGVMALGFALPMLWYLLRTRGWGAIGRLLPTAIPGAAVMFAMFVPWLWYMEKLFGGYAGGIFSHQVTERAAGIGDWTVEVPWYYLIPLVTLTLPWLGMLPGALAAPLMRRFRERREALAYLLLWCVGIFTLFTAAAAKREHYILPMIPAACLLMGFIAEDVFWRHEWIRPALTRLLGAAYGLVGPVGLIVTGVAAVVSPDRAKWVYMMVVAAVAAVPMTAAGVLSLRRRFALVPGLLVAGITLVYVGFFSSGDLWDPRDRVRDFAVEADRLFRAEGDGAVALHWGDPQAKTAFYFGRLLPSTHWKIMRQGGDPDTLHRRVLDWLADCPEPAPWILGYEKMLNRKTGKVERLSDAADLWRIGYRPVLLIEGKQDKRFTFALYRRLERPEAASRPGATAP